MPLGEHAPSITAPITTAANKVHSFLVFIVPLLLLGSSLSFPLLVPCEQEQKSSVGSQKNQNCLEPIGPRQFAPILAHLCVRSHPIPRLGPGFPQHAARPFGHPEQPSKPDVAQRRHRTQPGASGRDD